MPEGELKTANDQFAARLNEGDFPLLRLSIMRMLSFERSATKLIGWVRLGTGNGNKHYDSEGVGYGFVCIALQPTYG
jgi:hypothetical protein